MELLPTYTDGLTTHSPQAIAHHRRGGGAPKAQWFTKNKHWPTLPSGQKNVSATVAEGTKECSTELLGAGQAWKTGSMDMLSSCHDTEVQVGTSLMTHIIGTMMPCMTLVCKDSAVACQKGCAADSHTQGGDAAQHGGSHPTACWCRLHSLSRGGDEGERKVLTPEQKNGQKGGLPKNPQIKTASCTRMAKEARTDRGQLLTVWKVAWGGGSRENGKQPLTERGE